MNEIKEKNKGLSDLENRLHFREKKFQDKYDNWNSDNDFETQFNKYKKEIEDWKRAKNDFIDNPPGELEGNTEHTEENLIEQGEKILEKSFVNLTIEYGQEIFLHYLYIIDKNEKISDLKTLILNDLNKSYEEFQSDNLTLYRYNTDIKDDEKLLSFINTFGFSIVLFVNLQNKKSYLRKILKNKYGQYSFELLFLIFFIPSFYGGGKIGMKIDSHFYGNSYQCTNGKFSHLGSIIFFEFFLLLFISLKYIQRRKFTKNKLSWIKSRFSTILFFLPMIGYIIGSCVAAHSIKPMLAWKYSGSDTTWIASVICCFISFTIVFIQNGEKHEEKSMINSDMIL